MFIKALLKSPSGFLCNISARGFSGTFIQHQKPSSNLSKLRKSTGYALSKCKAALDKYEGNIEEATKWLDQEAQKEGWSKAEKVKGRAINQGTLVLYNDKETNRATILELNCETDFVARSEKFLDFTSNLAMSVTKNIEPSNGFKKIYYKDEINKLSFINDSSKTIADQIALAIGSLGENMSVRRAVIFNTQPNTYLSWYMHGSSSKPVNQCHFGKYGALVNMSFTETEDVKYQPFDIGRQICQHIVGLKPLNLGELPEIKSDSENLDENIKESKNQFNDNEDRLLYQEFLMKSDTSVADFLKENKAVVNNFVRFECGEFIDSEYGTVQSSS